MIFYDCASGNSLCYGIDYYKSKKLHLLNKSIDTIIKDLFVETKIMFMMFLLI